MRLGTVLIAALLLALPAQAQAGEYHVLMCGAEGAGVNNSWTAATGSFGNEHAPYYSFDRTCAGGLGVQSLPKDGTRAPWLTLARWAFEAPEGAFIARVRMWRYGEVRDDRGETAEEDGDHWRTYAHDEVGNPIGGGFFGEQCPHGAGVTICTVGSTSGMSAAPFDVADLRAKRIEWGVLCGGEITDGCQTSAFDYPLAYFNLYGADVTVTDEGAPAITADGSLYGDGVRPGTGSVDWQVSDSVGVKRVSLLVDGAEVDRDSPGCDFTKTAPCPTAPSGSLVLGDARLALRDGPHMLAVVAEDSAGNVARTEREVRIDANGPRVGAARVRGRSVSVSVSDAGSGVAGGELFFRPRRDAPFEPLPTTLSRGRLRARLPGESLRGKGLRVRATDRAGAVTEGQLLRLSLRARVDGRTRAVDRRIGVPFGKDGLITARLRTYDNVPVAGVPVTLTRRFRRFGSAFKPLRTVTTGARGRFTYRAPKGFARILHFQLPASADPVPRVIEVLFGTRATSSLRASATSFSGARVVRFSGRLRRGGARVPRGGVRVILQGFDRGRWRTFKTAVAKSPRGRWDVRYRFSGRTGRYPIRAKVTRNPGYPYEVGYSRRITVRVG